MQPPSPPREGVLTLPRLDLRLDCENATLARALEDVLAGHLDGLDAPTFSERDELVLRAELDERPSARTPGNPPHLLDDGIAWRVESVDSGFPVDHLGDDPASARIEETETGPVVELRLHPEWLRIARDVLSPLLGHVLRFTLSRRGLTPLRGAVAHLDSGDEPSSVLLFGEDSPLRATLAALHGKGWEVREPGVLYLGRREQEVVIFGASDALPELLPTALLGVSEAPELEAPDSLASAEAAASALEDISRRYINSPSAFRRTFFRLQQALCLPGEAARLGEEDLREHLEVLKDLTRSVVTHDINFFHGDPSLGARVALMHLGVEEPHGQDLNPPRIHLRGPVAIPGRHSYWEAI